MVNDQKYVEASLMIWNTVFSHKYSLSFFNIYFIWKSLDILFLAPTGAQEEGRRRSLSTAF